LRDEPGDPRQLAILNRLNKMGIRTRLMSGGRTVLASMSVGSEPFETLGRAVRVDDVVFSTVGQDRIKCLRPRLLFALPLLRVVNCRDAKAIEARIRTAWRQHLDELRASQRWGQSMNAEMGISEDGSLLSLTISGENRPARAYVCKPRTVILPGRGPLSGVALGRAEDRLHEIEPGIHSSVDLDISISNRIEELIRIDRRLEAERRRQAVREAEGLLGRSATQRSHRLLLVGPQIANERRCIDSLKLPLAPAGSPARRGRGLSLLSRRRLAHRRTSREDGQRAEATPLHALPATALGPARGR